MYDPWTWMDVPYVLSRAVDREHCIVLDLDGCSGSTVSSWSWRREHRIPWTWIPKMREWNVDHEQQCREHCIPWTWTPKMREWNVITNNAPGAPYPVDLEIGRIPKMREWNVDHEQQCREHCIPWTWRL